MPRRAPLQRRQDETVIIQKYRRGWTQSDIAQDLGVSQNVVSTTIKKLREQWSRSINTDLTYMALQQLDAYMDMLRELYTAWENSKVDGQKRVVEKKYATLYGDEARPDGDGDEVANGEWGATPAIEKKVTETVQGRLPAAEYMKQIADIRKAIRELFGLDAAQKVDVNASVFSWDMLGGAIHQEVPDKVLEEIERLTGPGQLSSGLERVGEDRIGAEGQVSGEENGG